MPAGSGAVPARLVLPIFPLPDVTLFPHTSLPLHVFEARYRALVTDALARDRRLAVPRLGPGWEDDYEGKPAVVPVAGVGEIVQWERLATGRYNVVLRGLARVRIEAELPTDTLYRVVRARRLDDQPAAGDVQALLAGIRASCRRLLPDGDERLDLLDRALGAGQAPGVVADRAAAAFINAPRLRQELLEILDVGRRLARVSAVLAVLVSRRRT